MVKKWLSNYKGLIYNPQTNHFSLHNLTTSPIEFPRRNSVRVNERNIQNEVINTYDSNTIVENDDLDLTNEIEQN